MESKEFSKDLIYGLDVEQEGTTLRINGVSFLPENVDFNDYNNVKILATNAVHTANGYYELIKNNYDISNSDVSSNLHLEMYLALVGLTCEIYMKSIIYNENLHNGKQYKGHKLDEIFNDLPSNHINTIKAKITGIETVLPDIGDVFETLRYDFELNHIKGSYLILFDFMEELKTISNSYPKNITGSIRSANGTLCFE